LHDERGIDVARRRQFGSIRKLPSGNYQASYDDGGKRVNAPMPFKFKADAAAWLSTIQADKIRGILKQPKADKTLFTEYADDWMQTRPTPLRPNTIEDYERRLRRHILPTFGRTPIDAINSAKVRRWHAELGREIGPSARAKAYSLLNAIMRTYADDKDVPNPCKIRHARRTDPAERLILDRAEVDALAEHITPRYRAMVLVGMYAHLRHGELIGLRRRDVDLEAGAVKVASQLQRIKGHSDSNTNGYAWVRVDPKSEAGKRTVHLPPPVAEELAKHLVEYVGDAPDSPVFTTSAGNPVHRFGFNDALKRAGKKIGRPDLHSHILRHSGLTLAAQMGATTKELMARGGHSDVKVSMRYQHATANRDRDLATRLAG
jgi:integrase